MTVCWSTTALLLLLLLVFVEVVVMLLLRLMWWNVCLHAVLLLQLEILLVQGVDTVNHDLDELNLRVAEPVLVGDVVGVASLRFSSSRS